MKIQWAVLALVLPAMAPGRALAQQYDQYGNPIPEGTQYDPGPQGDPQAYPQGDPQAYQYGFVGPHPEPYEYGNAPCYQQGAHFHPYPPFDQYLFRQQGGYFYFIGDLGDFGYSQQLWGYQGNHPIPYEAGGGFCYINWPHRHHFAAPPSMPFRYVGGYYTYYGAWDPAYYANRNAWTAYYNGYYRNSYYGGRYWTVRPQHIYRPAYGWGAPGVYRPGMTVRTPSGVSVSVGGGYYGRPGYVGRPSGVYVAPPPGRPGVYVAPPPGRPTVVTPPPRYVAPPERRQHGVGVIVGPPH
jgi:hypothetical protein